MHLRFRFDGRESNAALVFPCRFLENPLYLGEQPVRFNRRLLLPITVQPADLLTK